MNIEEIHKNLNKSTLIKVYRQYLVENKIFSKKKRLEGKYPQPIVNGTKYSWTQFRKLPKDAILVHVMMSGCTLDYFNKLEEELFFEEKRTWHENYNPAVWIEEEE